MKDLSMLHVYNSSIHKIQNQPRCPSADDWIKKMGSVYTMDINQSQRGMKHYLQESIRQNKPSPERQICFPLFVEVSIQIDYSLYTVVCRL